MSEANHPEGAELVAADPRDALAEFGEAVFGLERAKQIATTLDSIIQEKGLSVAIQGGEHIKVEAWCACASMVGISPKTVWVKPVQVGDTVEGYLARVEVVRISNGITVGAAEAGCFFDETYKNGKRRWNEKHAVISMAQTRATSKAIGQILRWIPVLAGYAGTPAEEMPRDEGEAKPARKAEVKTLSAEQVKRLWINARDKGQELGWTKDQTEKRIRDFLGDMGLESTKDLPAEGFEGLLEWIERWQPDDL